MQIQAKIILELISHSSCRHSCSSQLRAGSKADEIPFGHNVYFIADPDAQQYYLQIISALNSDKEYGPIPCISSHQTTKRHININVLVRLPLGRPKCLC